MKLTSRLYPVKKERPNSDNSSIYSEESISSKSETSSKAQIKRSKKKKKKMKKSKTIKDEKAEIKELFIGSLASTKLKGISHDWHVALETNNTTIVYKIDTGADANVISYEDYKSLKDKPRIKPVKIKLTAYNGTVIPVKGKYILNIRQNNSKTTPILFIVADIKSTPILGHQSSSRLNLIRRIYVVDRSKDVPEYVDRYSESFGVLGDVFHQFTI